MSQNSAPNIQRHRVLAGIAHLGDRIATLSLLARTMRKVVALDDARFAELDGIVADIVEMMAKETGVSLDDLDAWRDVKLAEGAGG